MNRDSLLHGSGPVDELVIVGSCNDLCALRHDELGSFNNGYLLAMGVALTVGLVELLVWVVV